ncbi:hypothetical protein KA529_04895, partial [Candidatus Saccharibacteria bacterium]|nr:hypothetical protein [Candidatus Saccharibacteria bacterium]
MSESVTNSYEIKYRTEADRAEANKELGHALRREALRSMIGNLFKTPSSEVRLAAVAERLTEPEEGKPGADSISSWLARYTKHIEMVGPTKAFKDKEQYVKELKIATADQRLNEAEESDIERPLSNHI